MRAVGKLLGLTALLCIAGTARTQAIDEPAGEIGAARPALKEAAQAARTTVRFETVRRPIPFEVRYELTRTLPFGRKVRKTAGQNGELVQTIRITSQNGRVVSRQVVDTHRTEPTHELFLMGTPRFQTSRSSFRRHEIREMESTAYTPDAGRGRNATFRTSTGQRAEPGIIAVDPRVIPLGSFVFVEGYGFAVAADVGSAIRGNKIDVLVPTREQARQWGRRTVRVHILR
ncbi:MAG: 3D domain-containing protein [Fimbriimonadaceae bacterium]